MDVFCLPGEPAVVLPGGQHVQRAVQQLGRVGPGEGAAQGGGVGVLLWLAQWASVPSEAKTSRGTSATSSRLLSITVASPWVMTSSAPKTGAPLSSLEPWITPADRAEETQPLAQVGMAASSEKPVTVTSSMGSRPAAAMARERNSARETVWSGSKKY